MFRVTATFALTYGFPHDFANKGGGIAIFKFLVVVRHLGFVIRRYASWESFRRVLDGLCRCAKFGRNWQYSFEDMPSFNVMQV